MPGVDLKVRSILASVDCNALQVWSKAHLPIISNTTGRAKDLLYSKNMDDKDMGWI